MTALEHVDQAVRLPPGHPDEFLGLSLTPAEQVRLLLERKRRQGVTEWRRVWPWAVGRIRWPHDREERHDWKATIAWAEPAFHAAFERDQLAVDMSALGHADLPAFFDNISA